MYQRIVFPIYNENNQIHGFAGRDVSPSSKADRPKWKHVGKKTKWIYPYFINTKIFNDSVKERGSVILVESIGDMLALFEKNDPQDIITLTNYLKDENTLTEIGGAGYLANLTSIVPVTANIASYARIIKQKSVLRRLIEVNTEIAGRCYEEQGEIDQLVDEAA